MNICDVLQFRGTWRTYQARALERAERYLDDGCIHIVAAPGSGKTTLGIELVRKLSEPALILAPTVTIPDYDCNVPGIAQRYDKICRHLGGRDRRRNGG